MAKARTSIVLKIYLLEKTRFPKEEGRIVLEDRSGKQTRINAHFDRLDDIPDKLRNMLLAAGLTWPSST